MNNTERNVKGIWIPIEIWEDRNLSWNEKILLLEIDSFTTNDKDCYMSNEFISNLLGICETSANKVLSSLISKGYVIKTSFDGRKRFVKSALQFTARQGCSKEQGSLALESNILNIDNNIFNNKKTEDNKLPSTKKEQTWREDFSIFLDSVNKAKEVLLNDSKFKAKQERYYPNLNYELSLHKMVEDYWGTEDAWEKRKKQKKVGEGIDMVSTLKKAFNQPCNRLYKRQTSSQQHFSGYSRQKVEERAKDYLKTLRVDVVFEKDGTTYLKDGSYIENGKRYYRTRLGYTREIPIGLIGRPNEDWEYDHNTMVWVQDESKESIQDMLF